MGLTVRYLMIDDIKEILCEEEFNHDITGLRKREEYLNFFNNLDATFIVEEMEKGYRLITGHKDYYVLRNRNRRGTLLPCRLYKYRNNRERLIHLLAHCLKESKTTTWNLKHNILLKLLDSNLSVQEVANQIRKPINEVTQYLIVEDVPAEFHTQVEENQAATTVNDMARFLRIDNTLDEAVKYHLFELATLPVNNPERLIKRRWDILKLSIENANKLGHLTIEEQLNWINLIFHYEEIVFRQSQNYINQQLSTPFI
ncbi:hypothetical protein JOD43_003721 [Pullulanibacillus pueri]|uniref:Uncharacterized protein n=1 Tax=Pullulanibacillus pueri TaxID=1437324 RepID=A0A8J3ENL0_9BACL|nr:hypothetical protein [Pullulanibacillus pueri]MBM7683541.1 hypothetical protein [Pullulanibacillus pueri]GGH86872.1 hypothetical protein GCM10007096_35580 [Pullulanibacillus pueri]